MNNTLNKLFLILILTLPGFAQNAIFFGGGSTPAGSAYTLIQQNSAGSTNCASTSGTMTCTMASNITAGHQLFLLVGDGINSGETFSSATGCNTSWSQLMISLMNAYGELRYCSNATGGGTAVTVTYTGSCGSAPYSCSGNLSEWTGGTGTVDQSNTATAINDFPTTPSITTTAANELILAIGATGSVASQLAGPTGGFTALTANSTMPLVFFAYRLVSSTGSYGTSWQFADPTTGWDAPIISLK